MSRHRGSGPISTLYVRNISDRVRIDDLRRLFSKYGKIVDVVIPCDYYSGMPKGYCFVQFEDVRDAEEAQYRMDRQRLFGREIEVEFARGNRKSSSEMRTRDRHHRSGPRDYKSDRRGRSRSGSRGRDRHERRGDRDEGMNGRSRSRSRSYPSNRTPSPAARNNRYKSASKDRSRSPRDRSGSRANSASPRRPASRSMSREVDSSPKRDQRSPRTSRSRSQSPA